MKNPFAYLRSFLRRGKAAPAASPAPPSASPARTGSIPLLPPGGSALCVSTVYRCVELLSGSVSTLPLQCLRKRGGIFVDQKGSRLHYLLNVQPCPHLSAVEFWQQVVRYLLLRGNAYIFPLFDAGTMQYARLALPDPAAVMHDTVRDLYTVSDPYAGVSGTFPEDRVLHLKNFSRDGKTGLSTLAYARTALDISRTGEGETLSRFANGGNVRGLVGGDTSVRGFGEYQDLQLQNLASDLDSRFRSGERIVSLPGQVQFQPLSLSSTDLQFLETRKFTVREICRFFGVHPSFVFDDTSNNYKSAEMANVAFLTGTLDPLLRKIEAELQRKLVAPTLYDRRTFRFDRRSLYACDLDSRVRYQAQTLAAGLYTVNEWRQEENRPPVRGGDEPLVSANLRTLRELRAAAAGGNAGEDSNEDTTDDDNGTEE